MVRTALILVLLSLLLPLAPALAAPPAAPPDIEYSGESAEKDYVEKDSPSWPIKGGIYHITMTTDGGILYPKLLYRRSKASEDSKVDMICVIARTSGYSYLVQLPEDAIRLRFHVQVMGKWSIKVRKAEKSEAFTPPLTIVMGEDPTGYSYTPWIWLTKGAMELLVSLPGGKRTLLLNAKKKGNTIYRPPQDDIIFGGEKVKVAIPADGYYMFLSETLGPYKIEVPRVPDR